MIMVTTWNEKKQQSKVYIIEDEKLIRLTNRAGKGISLLNLVKAGKTEVITSVDIKK